MNEWFSLALEARSRGKRFENSARTMLSDRAGADDGPQCYSQNAPHCIALSLYVCLLARGPSSCSSIIFSGVQPERCIRATLFVSTECNYKNLTVLKTSVLRWNPVRKFRFLPNRTERFVCFLVAIQNCGNIPQHMGIELMNIGKSVIDRLDIIIVYFETVTPICASLLVVSELQSYAQRSGEM